MYASYFQANSQTKKELAESTQIFEIETNQFAEKLAEGRKVSLGFHMFFDGDFMPSSKTWISQKLLAIDFDNSPKNLTQVLKDLKEYGPPHCFYETFSGGNNFRLIYKIDDDLQIHFHKWETFQELWEAFTLDVAEKTNLKAGKVSKNENDYVIDTNIIKPSTMIFGTNAKVYTSRNLLDQKKLSKVIKNAKKQAVEKVAKKEKQIKKEKMAVEFFTQTGKTINRDQFISRCEEFGVISETWKWLSVFNSMLKGSRLGLLDFSEDEAVQIFIDNCDNGKGNLKQYESMRANFKIEKANITVFYGVFDLPVDFSPLFENFENAKTLGDNEYIQPGDILAGFDFYEKKLVVANAGSGKTTATVQAVKQLLHEKKFERAIFALPTTVATKQIFKDAVKQIGSGLCASQYDNQDVYSFEQGNKQFLFCTFNFLAEQIKQKKVNYLDLIILDEIHLVNDFSGIAGKVTRELKTIVADNDYSIICLTATPHAIPKELFTTTCSFTKIYNKNVRLIQDIKTPKNRLLFFRKEILKNKANGKKTIIYMNSKIKGEKLKEQLISFIPGISVQTLHSENKKDNLDFETIIDESTFVSDVVIATKIINVAVNIKNTVGSIVGINLYDLTEIMQLINRERSACDFILLYNPKERKVANRALQFLLDSKKLSQNDVHELLKSHASKKDNLFELSSFITENAIYIDETINGDELTIKLKFDRWAESFKTFNKITRRLDPNDIQVMLLLAGVECGKVLQNGENVDLEEKDDDEDDEFAFSNLKEFFDLTPAHEMKTIWEDDYKFEQFEKAIFKFEKNQRAWAREALEIVALDPSAHGEIQTQKAFNKKRWTAWCHAKKAITTKQTDNPVLIPVIRASDNSDGELILEWEDVYNISRFANVELTRSACMSVIRKFVSISSKSTRVDNKAVRRFFLDI